MPSPSGPLPPEPKPGRFPSPYRSERLASAFALSQSKDGQRPRPPLERRCWNVYHRGFRPRVAGREVVMRTVSYSGVVADLASMERLRGPAAQLPAADGHWRAVTADQELFLRAVGVHCHLVEVGPVAVLLRGLAVPSGAARPPHPAEVARAIGARYLEGGDLDVDGLEGSFTVALMDARRGRL